VHVARVTYNNNTAAILRIRRVVCVCILLFSMRSDVRNSHNDNNTQYTYTQVIQSFISCVRVCNVHYYYYFYFYWKTLLQTLLLHLFPAKPLKKNKRISIIYIYIYNSNKKPTNSATVAIIHCCPGTDLISGAHTG